MSFLLLPKMQLWEAGFIRKIDQRCSKKASLRTACSDRDHPGSRKLQRIQWFNTFKRELVSHLWAPVKIIGDLSLIDSRGVSHFSWLGAAQRMDVILTSYKQVPVSHCTEGSCQSTAGHTHTHRESMCLKIYLNIICIPIRNLTKSR